MGNKTDKKVYSNDALCSFCKGVCCRQYAGIYHPDDFGVPITKEFIIELLDSGRYALDYWDGEFQHKATLGLSTDKLIESPYFIRPRHKRERNVKSSIGGQCVNWSRASGCSLKFDDRPKMCRHLKPNFNGLKDPIKDYDKLRCAVPKKDKAHKYDLIVAWSKHIDVLREVGKEYTAKTFPLMDMHLDPTFVEEAQVIYGGERP